MFEGKRILVTGNTGFLGEHVTARLDQTDATILGGGGRLLADLRQAEDTAYLLRATAPHYVIHLAYPGSVGIRTSVDHPAALVTDLLQMDLNVIRACAVAQVEKLLCIGSVCSYPETTILPTDESQLWNGYPEPVNAAYGLAKRTQLMLLQAYRQEFGLHGIHLLQANLYGPGDRSGHVIPATIAKVRQALRDGGPVVVWGRPDVTRSFLYVEDAAEGIVRALDQYDSPDPLNLCALEECTMRDLVGGISRRLGYTGGIQYDATKPTGHLRRHFSLDRLCAALDWYPPTDFATGLQQTIDWTLAEVPDAE